MPTQNIATEPITAWHTQDAWQMNGEYLCDIQKFAAVLKINTKCTADACQTDAQRS